MNNRKAFVANIELSKGRFVSEITVEAVDREGELIQPSGMVSKDFETNPVVFWNHNYDLPPIGKCIKLRRKEKSIEAVTEFALRPETHVGEWFPDTVKSLIEQDIIKGISIGYMPIVQRKAKPADKQKYGDNCQLITSKWDLLEYSVAPLQCNQEALITAVGKSIVSAFAAKSLFGVDINNIEPIVAAKKTVFLMPSVDIEAEIRKQVAIKSAKLRGQIYF